MAISKVIYKSSSSAQGVTWIDATPATAAAADIISPKTAMLADGVVTQGTGSGGITPSGNINITQAGQTNVTNYATATVPAAEANGSVSGGFVTASGVRKFRVTGTGYAESAGWVNEGEIQPVSQYDYDIVPANTVITPSASSQTVGGENYMMEGAVTIAAVPYAEATGTVTGAFVNVSGVRKFRISGASYAEVGGWVDGDSTVGTEATRDYDIVPANTTITPSTSAQTIGGANYMMEGAVTIAAVSGANIDTKTVTASNYPVSITFSSMKGTPKAFFLRSTSQISSSGSTTYYYVTDLVYDGNANNYCDGNCFRIGSTRRVDPITTTASGGVVSGYTWSYSGTTLTITSSASSRSVSPGSFNNGYKLVYIY